MLKKSFLFFVLSILFIRCDKPVTTVFSDEFKKQNTVLLFKEKPYTGTLVAYYKNTTLLRYQKSYKKGLLHGVAKEWYNNGVLKSERTYKHGRKTGIHKGWWSNQNNKYQFQYNNQGVFEGEIKEWHANGLLAKKFHYHQGKEEGSQQMWTSKGIFRANYDVIDGERFGLIGSKKCDAVE